MSGGGRALLLEAVGEHVDVHVLVHAVGVQQQVLSRSQCSSVEPQPLHLVPEPRAQTALAVQRNVELLVVERLLVLRDGVEHLLQVRHVLLARRVPDLLLLKIIFLLDNEHLLDDHADHQVADDENLESEKKKKKPGRPEEYNFQRPHEVRPGVKRPHRI